MYVNIVPGLLSLVMCELYLKTFLSTSLPPSLSLSLYLMKKLYMDIKWKHLVTSSFPHY